MEVEDGSEVPLKNMLGNSQNSDEAVVAIAKGNVIKSRSIVRVVAPS